LVGHTNGVTSLSFSPDSQVLASGSSDRTVKLWHLTNGTLIKTLLGIPDTVQQVSFSPDGKSLLVASESAGAMIWNFDLPELLVQSCDRLHDYLSTNPDLTPQERSLCP